ncbi:MAG: hypothetical protein ACJAV6_000511 [Candidatus Paceibacteria bacterium]|jgi:hypothetical protein
MENANIRIIKKKKLAKANFFFALNWLGSVLKEIDKD